MTRSSRTARATLASSLAMVVLAGAACSGSSSPAKSSGSAASNANPHTSGGASERPADLANVNPLRGGKPTSHGVVAVKIDDTGNGRPQRNVDQADIVYVEEVEGGLTRLLAVFSTILPTVEAVRSTRAADPELLAQYGPIGFVASGGARNPLRVLDASPLRTSINDRGGPGFQRDFSRAAPYNLTADLATVAKVLKAPKAHGIGFTWAYGAAQLAQAPAGAHVRTRVGSTGVAFDYDYKTKRYQRSIGGTVQRTSAGKIVSTPNVIVQFCQIEPYLKDRDVNGNPNAYTHTVGKGKLFVFRNGKRIRGNWQRPTRAAGTRLLDIRGKPIPLNPGGAWVVLVPRNARLG